MQVSRHWDDDDVKTQTATGNALFWDLTACERKKKIENRNSPAFIRARLSVWEEIKRWSSYQRKHTTVTTRSTVSLISWRFASRIPTLKGEGDGSVRIIFVSCFARYVICANSREIRPRCLKLLNRSIVLLLMFFRWRSYSLDSALHPLRGVRGRLSSFDLATWRARARSALSSRSREQ